MRHTIKMLTIRHAHGIRTDRSSGSRARLYGATAVLFVGVSAMATACSSTKSTSSGTTSTTSGVKQTCTTANTQFDTWLQTDHQSGIEDNNTTETWNAYDKTFTGLPPSSSQLTTEINQFNANNQKAQAARQTANRDLAQYQATVKNCNQSTLPAACQEDFAQHQPLIDAATRQNATNDNLVQLIISEQQAYRSGNLSGATALLDPYDAAVSQFNSATQTFNSAFDAHQSIASRCSGALI